MNGKPWKGPGIWEPHLESMCLDVLFIRDDGVVSGSPQLSIILDEETGQIIELHVDERDPGNCVRHGAV
jgi:hypothetical protein